MLRPGPYWAGSLLIIMTIKKYTIRLALNKQQDEMFRQLTGARRFVWNWALATLKQWREEFLATNEVGAKQKIDWNLLGREFTLLRRSTPWLQVLPCHTTRSAQHDLKIAMQAFFKRVKKGSTPGFPRFKSKYDSNQGFFIPDGCRVETNRLITFQQRIKMMRTLPLGTVGAAVRVKKIAGRWYASFTVITPDQQIEPVQPENLVGIDIGLKHYAVISDGTVVDNPRWTKQAAKKLAHCQRKLARQVRGSNRYHKIKQRIAKIHAGIANRRQHYAHLQSKRIADNYDAACIESHSIKEQMQGNLAKQVADVGQGHFRQCLEYKFADRGKQLIKADKYYPSSKECHACGAKLETLSLACRKWTCPICKTEHDRDFNAAKNLQLYGQQQVMSGTVLNTVQ